MWPIFVVRVDLRVNISIQITVRFVLHSVEIGRPGSKRKV